jgi:hypothetical protein
MLISGISEAFFLFVFATYSDYEIGRVMAVEDMGKLRSKATATN